MQKELANIIQAACKAFTDFINKAGSRKFVLILIATHAFYTGLLPANYWFMLAMAWQGVQGSHDMLTTYRGDKPKSQRTQAQELEESGAFEEPNRPSVGDVAL